MATRAREILRWPNIQICLGYTSTKFGAFTVSQTIVVIYWTNTPYYMNVTWVWFLLIEMRYRSHMGKRSLHLRQLLSCLKKLSNKISICTMCNSRGTSGQWLETKWKVCNHGCCTSVCISLLMLLGNMRWKKVINIRRWRQKGCFGYCLYHIITQVRQINTIIRLESKWYLISWLISEVSYD